MIDKPNILVILSRFPYPLEKGDKLRAYHQLKELRKSFDITLVAISDKTISEEHKKHIEALCISVHIARITNASKALGILSALFNGKPFQTGYFFRRSIQKKIKSLVKVSDIKHIYCQLIRTTEYVKEIHSVTKTLDYMDALSTGIERRVHLQPFYKKWIFKMEAKRLQKYERHIFDYFENRTIISDQDKKYISHPDRASIVSIPNGIEASFFEDLEHTNEYDFVFVGNMSYPPNIEAAHYIVNKILPHFSTATLLLSGATPHPSIIKLADSNNRITITGWVEDIRESYLKGKIFIAPMMIGTGMQNKLLEAMAMKTPCITTPLANNAIGSKVDKEILVGSNEKELLAACEKLLLDNDLRISIAENAHKMVKEKYNWPKSTNKLIELFNNTIENHVS